MLKLIGIGLSGLLVAAAGAAQSADEQSEVGGDKIPQGVILVKGAWSSASDTFTPLPEGGVVVDGNYDNAYFHLSYALSRQWMQRYSGPPPSDSGYYVLAQLEPAFEQNASTSAHVLIAAQDAFFSLLPAADALEQISYSRAHLAANYKVETEPREVRIANHSFVRFDYMAPAAGLHWAVLATQLRCHVVQFIFTGRDPKLLDKLIAGMNSMKLSQEPAAAPIEAVGDTPVCIRDYVISAQRLAGESPVLSEQRFNPIPVRIIIDAKGRVRHIHFLSAFAGQASAISDALSSWRFKPYLVNGQAVEVETGIMFGRAPAMVAPAAASSSRIESTIAAVEHSNW
jgi:hypothetical protein